MRIRIRQLLLVEPVVRVEAETSLEFHGSSACGWPIPRNSLSASSVVVDVGLGEDISFSHSLIESYGCTVHGFDPTPRAIEHARARRRENFHLHECGVGARRGRATFYLPNNEAHVSGSLVRAHHLGHSEIQVDLVTLHDVFEMMGVRQIDLLKLDIEGAEYELIASPDFQAHAADIGMLCIEFHHRWSARGRQLTLEAVRALNGLGFQCAWCARSTNEEFLFLNGRGPWHQPPA
jgi:FkbM family methyltransferase